MNQPKLSSRDQNWNTTPLKCSDEIERGYAGLLLGALQTSIVGTRLLGMHPRKILLLNYKSYKF